MFVIYFYLFSALIFFFIALIRGLEKKRKQVNSKYSQEQPVHCTLCKVERGCCKRRKLMLAMVEKILKWLKENKNQLQNIDFAHDVILIENNKNISRESDESDKKTISSSSNSLDSNSPDSA